MINLINQLIKTRLFFWLRWGQFIIAIAIFTGFALLPSNYIGPLPSSDKTLHFLGNFLLFSSAWVAFFGRMKLRLLIILLVPYSLAVELAQWLAPSRQVDSKDLIANISGLCAGYAVATLIEWTWTKIVRNNTEEKEKNGG